MARQCGRSTIAMAITVALVMCGETLASTATEPLRNIPRSTHVSHYQPNIDEALFRFLGNKRPTVWHLANFDIFKGNTTPPFEWNHPGGPQHHCTSAGLGFWTSGFETFCHDRVFLDSFLSSEASKMAFWTSSFFTKKSFRRVHWWDGTKFDEWIIGGRGASWNGYWERNRFKQSVYRPGKRDDTGFLCQSVTFKHEENRCGPHNVLIQKWSYSGGLYHAARHLCRLVMGFDFPTESQLSYFMQYTGTCGQYGRDFSNAWVLKGNHNPAGWKRFLCIGCRVHFKDAVGMKSVDPQGNVVCKPGYILQVAKDAAAPTCVDDGKGNWSWKKGTLPLCKRVGFDIGHDIYYMPVNNDSQPIRAVKGEHVECPSGTFLTLNVQDTHEPRQYPVVDQLMPLLGHWGSPQSEAPGIWLRHFRNDWAVLFTSPKTVPKSERQFRIATSKNVHHGKYSEGSQYIICKTHCIADITGMKHLDWAEGYVQCKPGLLWSCTNPPCPREGHPRPVPMCSSAQRHRWTNLARCIGFTHGLLQQLLIASGNNLHIDAETAKVRCRGNTYEACAGSGPCAGGPGNIAATNNGHQFTNLPSCRAMRMTDDSGLVYGHSSTTETADMARWACKQLGMKLLSEIHYTSSSHPRKGIILGGTDGRFWIEDTSGTVRLFQPGNSRGSQLSKEDDQTKARFVCIKYKAGANNPVSFNINYQYSPEQCRSGTNTDPGPNPQICQ